MSPLRSKKTKTVLIFTIVCGVLSVLSDLLFGGGIFPELTSLFCAIVIGYEFLSPYIKE